MAMQADGGDAEYDAGFPGEEADLAGEDEFYADAWDSR